MRKYFICFLLLFGSTLTLCAQHDYTDFWQQHFVNRVYGQKYVGARYDGMVYSRYKGRMVGDTNIFSPRYICSTPYGIYQDNGFSYSLLTEDSLYIKYYKDGNYTYGRITDPQSIHEKNIVGQLLSGLFRDIDYFAGFYLFPSREESFQYSFSSIEASDDNTTHILKYVATDRLRRDFYEDNYVQAYDTIIFYIDDTLGLVNRVVWVQDEGDMESILDYSIRDISFDKPVINDNQYRLRPDEMGKYDVYCINKDEDNNPSEGFIYVPDESLDVLLNAPLLSTNGDTIRMKDARGWILVDFWTYGCKPCVKQFKRMKQEQDSLGYRMLEHEGISVYCVNIISRVTDYFVEFAKTNGISDIAFSGKETAGSLNVYSYPYYVLISPDRKIVYRGSYLENTNTSRYNLILDAKNNYYKQ